MNTQLPMLQVALDNLSMAAAYDTTRLIAAEVDIIEVGTILCVAEGVRAVRDLKALYPDRIVLADAKSPMRVRFWRECASRRMPIDHGDLLCRHQYGQGRPAGSA